jgi:hypothetical protein
MKEEALPSRTKKRRIVNPTRDGQEAADAVIEVFKKELSK